MLIMNCSDLANLTLRELCDLYRSGYLPNKFKGLSLSEIVKKSAEENDGEGEVAMVLESVAEHGQHDLLEPESEQVAAEPELDQELERGQHDVLEPELDQVSAEPELEQELEVVEKIFWWRESLPNSNYTNIPILVWRGDENNSSTLALAFGLYEDEFEELQKDHIMEVNVENSDNAITQMKFQVDLDFPKDEKLSRKHAGMAASGSDNMCTYCTQSRKTVKVPPYSGDNPVTLTNALLKEASHYCRVNPSKKSQEQLSKIACGVKEVPFSSTEPKDERPDSLHLDINVTKHLVTIASRLFHHEVSGQPLKYEKSGLEKKEMESSEALYHKILRRKVTTLPEMTQCPGNFYREFMAEENKNFVAEPLPKIPETDTWKAVMELWRKMRAIHKSSNDPTDDEISEYKSLVIEFQKKLFSFEWVPVANQIHRISHIAFFMLNKKIRSVGAYSLEGLEHGNFSTKGKFQF